MASKVLKTKTKSSVPKALNVFGLTVELDRSAILRGMQAQPHVFAPGGPIIERIMIIGQVGTPEPLDQVKGPEGNRVVRVMVVYAVPFQGTTEKNKLLGVISHDISLELLRQLEEMGR